MTWIALELNPELSTFSIEIILSYFTIYRAIKKELNTFQNLLLGAPQVVESAYNYQAPKFGNKIG
jgi:hypothetical protein